MSRKPAPLTEQKRFLTTEDLAVTESLIGLAVAESLWNSQAALRRDVAAQPKALAQLLHQIQFLQERELGDENEERFMTKIPACLFRDFAHPQGGVKHILQWALDFRDEEAPDLFTSRRWDLLSSKNRKKACALLCVLRDNLKGEGLWPTPNVYIWSEVAQRKELCQIVKSHGGVLVEAISEAGYVVLPNDTLHSTQPTRGVDAVNGRILQHWVKYPDSYDQWVIHAESASEPPMIDLLPPPDDIWKVSFEWLLLTEKYNEWMNPSDFQIPPEHWPPELREACPAPLVESPLIGSPTRKRTRASAAAPSPSSPPTVEVVKKRRRKTADEKVEPDTPDSPPSQRESPTTEILPGDLVLYLESPGSVRGGFETVASCSVVAVTPNLRFFVEAKDEKMSDNEDSDAADKVDAYLAVARNELATPAAMSAEAAAQAPPTAPTRGRPRKKVDRTVERPSAAYSSPVRSTSRMSVSPELERAGSIAVPGYKQKDEEGLLNEIYGVLPDLASMDVETLSSIADAAEAPMLALEALCDILQELEQHVLAAPSELAERVNSALAHVKTFGGMAAESTAFGGMDAESTVVVKHQEQEDDAVPNTSKPVFKLPSNFLLTGVNEIETLEMVPLFDSEAEYISIRNDIIAEFQIDSVSSVTFQDVQRLFPLRRKGQLLCLWQFLQINGLINNSNAVLDKRRITNGIANDGTGTPRPVPCLSCGKLCLYTYYQVRRGSAHGVLDHLLYRGSWCLRCFADGCYPPPLKQRHFVKVTLPLGPPRVSPAVPAALEVAPSPSGNPVWAPEETERLLEALEQHGESWEAVATAVGRPAVDCVAHFLRLPIADSDILWREQYDTEDEDGDPFGNPFAEGPNALLALLRTLRCLLGPKVSDAASAAGCKYLTELLCKNPKAVTSFDNDGRTQLYLATSQITFEFAARSLTDVLTAQLYKLQAKRGHQKITETERSIACLEDLYSTMGNAIAKLKLVVGETNGGAND